MEYKKHSRKLRHYVSIPFIYSMIIPLIILHIFIKIYQHVCFPLYGLSPVKRKNYIRIDRHKLNYLNWFEKINCAYCGYAIGLIQYCSAIGAKTEKYWCGIKHKKHNKFIQPSHHKNFLKYSDEKEFNKKYNKKFKQ